MATHRTVKRRDANLEKLYAQYSVAAVSEQPKGQPTATPRVEAVPVLTPAEAKFVRRDLARVAVSAFITLLAIVAVYLTSGAPYWTNFVNWLTQLTHF